MIKSSLSIFFSILTVISNAQDLFKSNLQYGSYGVGFKNIDVTDLTRPSLSVAGDNGAIGREMNLSIWYPSLDKGSSPVLYKDYVALTLPHDQRNSNALCEHAFMHTVAELSGDTTRFQYVLNKMLAAQTKAHKNAVVAKGSFPVIIYPDRAHVQSIMCEYLASNGYIVVSLSIKGSYAAPMEYNVRGIETAIEDLQFALGYARQNFVTTRYFSVIGLGFNATNLLAWQMRNADIKAFVSLEGGITTGFEDQLIQKGPFFNVERCTVDMLVIHAPHPDVKPEFTYKYKYAQRIYQSYSQSSEFYFLNFGIWERELKNIFPAANRGNTWLSFEYAAASIKSFLDWRMRGDEDSKTKLLKPEPGIVEVTVKQASLLPPSVEELNALIKKQGINAASALYFERKKIDERPFPFTICFLVGQNLIQQASFNDLKNWAQLFADGFPQSAIPYTMQARAFLEEGNKEQAKLFYNKAMALLDSDENLSTDERKAYQTAIDNRLKSIN